MEQGKTYPVRVLFDTVEELGSADQWNIVVERVIDSDAIGAILHRPYSRFRLGGRRESVQSTYALVRIVGDKVMVVSVSQPGRRVRQVVSGMRSRLRDMT